MAGEMGEVPDWYALIHAARYLGVAPWDLAEQPLLWQQAALVAETVEHEAEEALAEQARVRQQASG